MGGPLGKGNQWLSWIHIQDLTTLIIFIITHQELTGAINAVAPNPERMRDFSKILGKVLHSHSWLPVPEIMLKIVLGQMAEMLLHGQRAVPKKLLDANYDYKFPTLKEALENVLRNWNICLNSILVYIIYIIGLKIVVRMYISFE